MTKRENVRLIEEIKGYASKHEEVKEEGYDEAAQQNPHVETPGFVHKTATWFNDTMYEFQAKGRCACMSNFKVTNEVLGWSGMTMVHVHLSKKNGPCTAIWPAIERANARVAVALERRKVCGMCCGATVRADGKTTGWGHFEGKICPACNGVGTRPQRDFLSSRFASWDNEMYVISIASAIARLRAHLKVADDEAKKKDPLNYRLRSTATWWLREILAFVLDKAWEAEIEQVRAQAEEK